MANFNANDLKHYLDQAGLAIVWGKIDNLFARKAALDDYVTESELATALSAYYTKTEVDSLLNAIRASVTAEETRAKAEEAKKVDKEITSANGKALIFNEADGGGAKFENTDGTWSFAGVNNGGASGLAAQVYAVDSANNYKGAKLDVQTKGIFYTTGDNSTKSYTERDVAANEIAVKGDIAEYTMVKDANPGEYASVYHLTKNGTNIGAAIEIAKDQVLKKVDIKTCTEKDVPIPGLNVGDKYIDFEWSTGTHTYLPIKDFVKAYSADEETLTLSSENVFSVKAVPISKVTDLQSALDAKASVTSLNEEIANREAAVTAEASTRATEDAKKVDKNIVGTSGTAKIFNEADGGGAKFEFSDGSESFVGVNSDGNSDGLMAQIYADKLVSGTWSGSRINVYNKGIFYQSKASKDAGKARDNEKLEIATIGDVEAHEPASMTQAEIEAICQ